MLIGSVVNGSNSSGGFCAGSCNVEDHQRINGTSFVFSAAVPAVSASKSIDIFRNTPSILSKLHENMRAIRAVLDRIDSLTIASHVASPINHIHLRTATPSLTVAAPKVPNPATAASRDALSFDIPGEEHLLQDIVNEVLAQGMWITRARWLRG